MSNNTQATEALRQEYLAGIDAIEGAPNADCPAPTFASAISRGLVALLHGRVIACDQLLAESQDRKGLMLTAAREVIKWAVVAAAAALVASRF